MQYKIEITEITTVEGKDKTWLQLHEKEDFNNETEPQYGYVEAVLPITKESTIYTQATNKPIDLKGIIDAFNNFKKEA